MNKRATILVIDDQKAQADGLVDSLSRHYANVKAIYSASEAVELIRETRYDVVITDLHLDSRINGIDILNDAKAAGPATAVFVLADSPTIETCKEAIRRGASDYLPKPVGTDYLLNLIAQALAMNPAHSLDQKDFVFEGVLGQSQPMQLVYRVLKRVAPTDISVLIEGESGTGKELLARSVHSNSRRRNFPFRPINCAGLTETLLESELFGHAKGAFTGATGEHKGLFEMADQGTLFLDEIGDMPLNMQAKLLRVLEDGLVTPVGSTQSIKVDVRVVSATNHNLAALVEEGKFRQDLYFRVKGVSVSVPPLRSRREDLEELFGYFLKEACDETGRDIRRITEPAMSILKAYPWPGNIRQLRHVVHTMVVLCENDTLDVEDIPLDVNRIKRLPTPMIEAGGRAAGEYTPRSLQDVEKQHIEETLRRTGGNRAEAAKILEIGERTLYRKIKEYDLQV